MQVGRSEAANDTPRTQTLGGDDEIAVALDVKSQ
jgi:hypothetical protein